MGQLRRLALPRQPLLPHNVPILHGLSRFYRVQTKVGGRPEGLCADEWSEMVRLGPVRKASSFAAANFCLGGDIYWTAQDEAMYVELKRRLGWKVRLHGPLYFLARDQDKRHSFKDMALFRRTGQEVDRTKAVKGGPARAIRFNRLVQELPTGDRVPDAMQCPIEMLIALNKRAVHSDLRDRCTVEGAPVRNADWRDMQASIQALGATFASPQLVQKCWEHGAQAVRVFAGTRGESVQIKGRKVHCTHGGWTPKFVRG